MTTSPTGATFDGQRVSWTPTSAQSRIANDFSIKATTAAGVTKTQSWAVTPAGSVNFKEVSHYLTDSGVVDVVTTLPDSVIVQQNGTVFTTYNATAQPDGSLKFADISGWRLTNAIA